MSRRRCRRGDSPFQAHVMRSSCDSRLNIIGFSLPLPPSLSLSVFLVIIYRSAPPSSCIISRPFWTSFIFQPMGRTASQNRPSSPGTAINANKNPPMSDGLLTVAGQSGRSSAARCAAQESYIHHKDHRHRRPLTKVTHVLIRCRSIAEQNYSAAL